MNKVRSIMNDDTEPQNSKRVNLWYLMINFLKIGSTSFGGHMALISVVQDQMVKRDEIIDDDTILNGISLATILPGPFAMNVVTFIGYKLLGFRGAMVSLAAITIPSFALVLLLSIIYFNYQDELITSDILKGILPAVSAIVLSVAIGMTKKNIRNGKQVGLMIFSFVVLILLKGFLPLLGIVLFGGLAGFVLFQNHSGEFHLEERKNKKLSHCSNYKLVIAIGLLLLFIFYILLSSFQNPVVPNAVKLASVFGSMSLTLFGGGYVFIPMMNEIVVDSMNWVTNQEFADAIAMGQITPGPIMISAVFIGYKVMGYLGAVIATVAMFLPSGVLTIVCSKFMLQYVDSPVFQSIFKGIHAVAIGMIYAAVIKIGIDIELSWQALAIAAVSILLLLKYQLNAVYIIPLAAGAGYFIF